MLVLEGALSPGITAVLRSSSSRCFLRVFDCLGHTLFKKQWDAGGEQSNCNPKWDFYGPLKESSSPLDPIVLFAVAVKASLWERMCRRGSGAAGLPW